MLVYECTQYVFTIIIVQKTLDSAEQETIVG